MFEARGVMLVGHMTFAPSAAPDLRIKYFQSAPSNNTLEVRKSRLTKSRSKI